MYEELTITGHRLIMYPLAYGFADNWENDFRLLIVSGTYKDKQMSIKYVASAELTEDESVINQIIETEIKPKMLKWAQEHYDD